MLNINDLNHFGSDGASTMLGHRNGVAARLKRSNPFITENHCIAHRLHLAGEDAVDQVPYFKKYDKTLKNIYRYFSSLYKRLLNLKLIQNTLEEPELVLLKIISTRWLSFSNVIKNFHQILESVKGALLDDAAHNNTALELLSTIDEEFEIVTMFLADFFFILNKLIQSFQSDNVTLSDVQNNLNMTIEAIQLQFIGNDDVDPTYGTNLQDYLLQNSISKSKIPSFIYDFSNGVITSFKNHFSNQELYSAMRIYDPQQLPINNNELANYGEKEIDILCDFYGTEKVQDNITFNSLLDKRALKSEWGLVKLYLKNFRNLHFIEVWQKIFSQTSFISDYPATFILVKIILVAPISNANVERVFSQQNLIKTQIRNQMSLETLNDHLMVKLNGPSIDLFDFELAFEHWYSKKRHI
jgi:hypothetical protein